MRFELFWFLMGRAALCMGILLLLPLGLSLHWREGMSGEYLLPFFGSVLLGIFFSWLGREHRRQLRIGEGAIYMTAVWLLMGVIGMMPYLLSGTAGVVDAFFESISAVTTTGSSLIAAMQPVPRSLVFWHSLLEWIGGMNFIVMLVTVLPQVAGCFGVTLSARQMVFFSPVYHRMASAAYSAIKVYMGLTVLSMLLYLGAGMDSFDALTCSFTTLSTSGGPVPSGEFLDNPWLEVAAVISMLLGSGNFLLYWKGIAWHNFRMVWQDSELRSFLMIFVVSGLAVSLHLWHKGLYTLGDSLRYGLFQVASFLSTSGFTFEAACNWPDFDRYVLFLLVFVGGCIGSATGGLKVMRLLVLFKMVGQEMRRTLHPHMVVSVKLDGRMVPMKILSRIMSYFFLYILVFVFAAVVMSLAGITPAQAMGLSAGCLSSAGATAQIFGLSDLMALPDWLKVFSALLMVLGRVEIFSLLLVLGMGVHHMQHRW